jgi:arylsulfatase A-like enzyme
MSKKIKRREFLNLVGAGAVTIGLPTALWPKSGINSRVKRPNIILFLTDDQGWTDTSVQMKNDLPDSKSTYYQTPALEELAQNGMIFSSAYSPAPVCTPTRCSIQWGKTPTRLKNTGHYRMARRDFNNEISIAQAIKTADPNYVTAHFGKWGGQNPSPNDAGYDVSDGDTNNYHGDWRSHQDERPISVDDPKQIFSITERANSFMADQVKAKKPFYMQLSHYALHAQHRALKETIEKYRKLPRGKKCMDEDYQDPPPGLNSWALEYAAMIENLDSGLNGIMKKVNELGIADDTYIIFTSDNGGSFRGNDPLRGEKSSLWEGGIRVPTVVQGPGIRPGTYCDVPVAGWDFLPTFADLAGGSKNNFPLNIDGTSLRPLFENKKDIKRSFDGLVFHFPDFQGDSVSAIRMGDYKLVKDWETFEIYLYNLTNDIGEENDLKNVEPERAETMHKQLSSYLAMVDAEKAEDIHLDTVRQSKEQMIDLNKQMRDLFESDDPQAREKWARLNMRRGWLRGRIANQEARLNRINEIKAIKFKE